MSIVVTHKKTREMFLGELVDWRLDGTRIIKLTPQAKVYIDNDSLEIDTKYDLDKWEIGASLDGEEEMIETDILKASMGLN